MSKRLKILCSLILVLAVSLAVLLFADLFRGFKVLSSMEKDLSESRTRWETVAADKEALQDELSEVTDSLKEARLTLSESETRAGELRADIAQLESDIAQLNSDIEVLSSQSGAPAVSPSGP